MHPAPEQSGRFQDHTKKTRKERFPGGMDQSIPWYEPNRTEYLSLTILVRQDQDVVPMIRNGCCVSVSCCTGSICLIPEWRWHYTACEWHVIWPGLFWIMCPYELMQMILHGGREIWIKSWSAAFYMSLISERTW